MVKLFVEAWDANKGRLEEFFKTTEMIHYDEYVKLVSLLFEKIINPYLKDLGYSYDTDMIHVIDDGNWQGYQLFVIPIQTYQPSAFEYVITYTGYGSCSGCDTLMRIQHYGEELPNEEQVKEHMTLCLHLLQRCKIPFSYEENDYDY